MILEDFVMLGTTVPEPNSDGRVFVCSAGVSREYGSLVRIYPLARRHVPNRWNVYRVPVERNPKDSRHESFKLAGDRAKGSHEYINERFQLVDQVKPKDRLELLRRYVVGSIAEANAKRLSLAVVHPDRLDVHFEHNPESPDSPQMALFDTDREEIPQGARRFPLIPRIRFRDEAGPHNLMLRDWGTYELQRKNGQDYFRKNLAGALHLKPSSSLLVGNLSNQRNAWLVISVLNGLRAAPTLFDALPDERTPIPDKIRREVFQRDEWKCVRCQSPDNLTIDHVWPHSRGGTNAIDNLQTLCKSCNSSKNDGLNGAA